MVFILIDYSIYSLLMIPKLVTFGNYHPKPIQKPLILGESKTLFELNLKDVLNKKPASHQQLQPRPAPPICWPSDS
jgi:hypothetical protein